MKFKISIFGIKTRANKLWDWKKPILEINQNIKKNQTTKSINFIS